jgi:hypothetical protein
MGGSPVLFSFGAMASSVSFQRLRRGVWVARAHEGPDGRYGDPWFWCCVVERRHCLPGASRWRRLLRTLADWSALRGGDVAHLFASMGRYPPSAHRALSARLKAMGFTHRYHERIKDGVTRYVVVEL